MSIVEKLQTIAENEQKVFNKGYEQGKSEGIQPQDFEITSEISNAKQLYDIVFANIPKNHIATAYLVKDKSEYIYDQIPLFVFGVGSGLAVRNRDDVLNSFTISTAYNAAVTIGDIYRVFDLGELQL